MKKKILWVINLNVTIFDTEFNSASYMLPLESSQGGLFDLQQFSQMPENVMGIPVNIPHRRFSFVPTTSSLDVGAGVATITSADLRKAYSPSYPPSAPKHIPFHNFFTNPNANEIHTRYTRENGNWLIDEIDGGNAFYSCAHECSAYKITIGAPPVVCTTEASFSVFNLPRG